jgi:hypothetical protein
MYEADSSDSGWFATASFMISRVDLLPDRRFSFAFTALVYLVIIFNPKRIKSFLDVTTSLRILLVFSQKTHQPKFSSVWLVATGPALLCDHFAASPVFVQTHWSSNEDICACA